MARIIVCGYMVRLPMPGMQLGFLSYILGLRRLGHDVVYVEESGWPRSCYDPLQRTWGNDPTPGLRSARGLLMDYRLECPLAYFDRDTGQTFGCQWEDLRSMLERADLLLNLSGVCWMPEFLACPRRALIDTDPLFTQVGMFGGPIAKMHNRHFSFGVNIGQPGCSIPTSGLKWHPTLPPVVPEIWPASPGRQHRETFTTVANWTAHGGVTCNGEHYGQKDEEFLRLLDLPRRTRQRLELALSGASDETTAQLRAAGWSVRDAEREVNIDMNTYMSYVAESMGEFSAAKNAYVKTRGGWFSDRSICYLASARPIVVQDTGIGSWLKTGMGVLTFSTQDEAVDQLAKVEADYTAHSAAARCVAEEVFSYRKVLPELLEVALSSKGD